MGEVADSTDRAWAAGVNAEVRRPEWPLRRPARDLASHRRRRSNGLMVTNWVEVVR